MGFMVGSLNKVWPWKQVVETYVDNHGQVQPLIESNISPATFETLYDKPALLSEAIILCIVGFLVIYGIEVLARIVAKKNEK